MMYDFDIDKNIVEILPPDKRYLKNIAIVRGFLSPLKWAHNLLFNYFYNGTHVDDYAPGTYNYQDLVRYNKKIYSSLKDNNTDNPTLSSWILVQDNFIGIKERIKYNGSKIVLEYAINKEFDTQFRQPPGQSDIYITNIDPVIYGFIVGESESLSSSAGETTSSDTIGYIKQFDNLNYFQINIPNSVYLLTNDSAIRNFVNKYLPVGIYYIIQSY